ncbi:hypothetical protein JVX90_16720 [Gordonia sp. PDNC005]|uniref:hypothetical protein n=1 Tax=unclassified Gordonia (in: high G+C Gram-positive bacteria) TaxID=2657482 RepID=UPI001963B840|nr:hypothetical protein [Gordonia sp. PDNC005]QRY62025.1 hypothetical protein JVX90_16720 [Gordonia sp. PDNC005]
MPDTLQTIRGKTPSTRVLLAIGGAAAVAVGAFSTTDTLAAENDTVNANTSQIASQNFFPVLAPTNPSYSNTGWCGGNPTLKWAASPNTPADQRWIMEEWSENGGSLMWTSAELTSTSRQTGMESGGGGTHVYRIYGLNNTTKERSTGYVSIYVWRNNGSCGRPEGTATEGRTAVTTWQETTSHTPFDAEEVINPPSLNRSKFNAPTDTQTPKSTAPSSESASVEPSAPSEPSPTESSAPKAPVKITAASAAAGAASGFIIYHDGVEKCSGPKAETDIVNFGNNHVTLTTADGAVKNVDVNTCEVS